MTSSAFPTVLYRRLLRAAKCIDSTESPIPFQSLLCGKPSSLYSYELKKNINIGVTSYSLYDKLVSVMNDGEYSSPIDAQSSSMRFYSLICHTARNINSKKTKLNMLINSEYCENITLSESELIEIVTNFESLASIANKYKSQQNIENALTKYKSQKNTFECGIVEWNNNQLSDKDIQMQIINNSNKKVKKQSISLEFVPKGLTKDIWRNCILFQHPLCAIDTDMSTHSIEPYVLLGLFALTNHSKLSAKKHNNVRIALIMNGEKSLIKVCDIISEQKMLSTFHGMQTIPQIFSENNVFIGGDDLSNNTEILTTNPYCKGIGVLSNKLFWNPDLQIAERIISSGYGSVEQFRFFKGKMKWNNHLWNNIEERNMYALLSTARNTSASWPELARLIWSYANNSNSNRHSLWYQLLDICHKNQNNEIESWMQLFTLINQNHSDLKQEICQLVEMHNAKISKQVKHYQQMTSSC